MTLVFETKIHLPGTDRSSVKLKQVAKFFMRRILRIYHFWQKLECGKPREPLFHESGVY